MFVTAYYDIYNKPTSFMTYIYLFYDLVSSGIPITIFTDPSLVSKFRIFPSNLKVIGIPLEEFELYKISINYSGELPSQRNPEKDTKEFLALMNTKAEFVKKASELSDDDSFIWIDFGILKIINNVERFINKLKLINEKKYDKITIPGCWGFGAPFSLDSVNWRFCGGFFVTPRKYVDTFYNHCKNVLTDFCTMPQYKLSWETNIWYIIEFCAAKDIIDWYFADHDDSIALNITNQ
jgi:hypothetical protein